MKSFQVVLVLCLLSLFTGDVSAQNKTITNIVVNPSNWHLSEIIAGEQVKVIYTSHTIESPVMNSANESIIHFYTQDYTYSVTSYWGDKEIGEGQNKRQRTITLVEKRGTWNNIVYSKTYVPRTRESVATNE
jgi:hypothetical protein